MVASASQAAIPVTANWSDLVATIAGLASVDVDLQFNGRVESAVLEYRLSGAQPAANVRGRTLKDGQSVSVNSDHIWVRAPLGGNVDAIII